MKKNNILLISSVALLGSCGILDNFKTANSEPTVTSTSDANDNPLENVPSPTSSEVVSERPAEPSGEKNGLEALMVNEAIAADAKKEENAPQMVETPQNVETPTNLDSAVVKIYKVKKGETLMQIAFKLYGDVTKWKELKKLNEEKIARDTSLPAQMSLKYAVPASEFIWNPEGNPYLIKNGETLGIISKNIYQTAKRWNEIWENNKPLIKNPNVIYSGFTLYYKGEKMPELAPSKLPNPVIPDVANVPTDKVAPIESPQVTVAVPTEVSKEVSKEASNETTRSISSEIKK
jgi:nucleoid-associated protein YgaU